MTLRSNPRLPSANTATSDAPGAVTTSPFPAKKRKVFLSHDDKRRALRDAEATSTAAAARKWNVHPATISGYRAAGITPMRSPPVSRRPVAAPARGDLASAVDTPAGPVDPGDRSALAVLIGMARDAAEAGETDVTMALLDAALKVSRG